MNSLLEMDLAYCDSCGNYVPVVEDEGSLVCAYEYAEYPELATVVGQCRWSLIVLCQTKGKLKWNYTK